jgi:hypothetical protein
MPPRIRIVRQPRGAYCTKSAPASLAIRGSSTSKEDVEKNRAAVEIPFHYRHRGTGTVLETTKANFWTLEDSWPVW